MSYSPVGARHAGDVNFSSTKKVARMAASYRWLDPKFGTLLRLTTAIYCPQRTQKTLNCLDFLTKHQVGIVFRLPITSR